MKTDTATKKFRDQAAGSPLRRPEPGDILEFKGCTFDAGWDFGCPAILYSPVCGYSQEGDLYALVERACIDICIEQEIDRNFEAGDLHEFQWRGWSPSGFKRRKNARHKVFRIRFYKARQGGLTFELLKNV